MRKGEKNFRLSNILNASEVVHFILEETVNYRKAWNDLNSFMLPSILNFSIPLGI